jgi:hypothetical protein
MKFREFFEAYSFRAGDYEIRHVDDAMGASLLKLTIPDDDQPGSRHVPSVVCRHDLERGVKRVVLSALVRAGARHPGLRDQDLAGLHRVAEEEGHLELFSDLNALTSGLLRQIALSLGKRLSRVIISSSSIDVLHEYQSLHRSEKLKKAEMVRALRVLDEIRRSVPVHVHQLPPGSVRYHRRKEAEPEPPARKPDEDLDLEGLTYISEDRQMMGAFWDYQTHSNPRLPVYLITSDFALAQVCAAERALFLFAKTPFEVWKDQDSSILPETLWFDPFALSLRTCTPHSILWELSMIFGQIGVPRAGTGPGSEAHLILTYDHRKQIPGEAEELLAEEGLLRISEKPQRSKRRKDVSVSPPRPPRDVRTKVSLLSILEALPTNRTQIIPYGAFKPHDEDRVRQFRQLGEVTQLYAVTDTEISAGPALDDLLKALGERDYLLVNRIFRQVPSYDRVLREVSLGGRFPNSTTGGSSTGWAIGLGAGYKTPEGVFYGLAEVSQERFDETVLRFYLEAAVGQNAVPIPPLLDKTCRVLHLSPIRFETMLALGLGRGALARFEPQRASIEPTRIPPHKVIVAPTSSRPSSYIRDFEPGRGVVIGRVLFSSLVRRLGVI